MRLSLRGTAPLALPILVMGCTWVSADQCWPNTSGGFGGGGTIPIGAGVGVTTGGFNDNPEAPNPCVTTPSSPGNDDSVEASMKVFCFQPEWGPPCAARCVAQSIGCVQGALHPYKPAAGVGLLFSCNDLVLGHMCGYHYPSGDDCYYYFVFGSPRAPWCSYSGGG